MGGASTTGPQPQLLPHRRQPTPPPPPPPAPTTTPAAPHRWQPPPPPASGTPTLSTTKVMVGRLGGQLDYIWLLTLEFTPEPKQPLLIPTQEEFLFGKSCKMIHEFKQRDIGSSTTSRCHMSLKEIEAIQVNQRPRK
ncbi:hypothetical protein RHMOL_Rhmol10G0227900 [Rhododendron molle]|uniref:Uncharacterized protein n=1 Tax=Rhododendron molle TaxID=49168 RepID=A0ACC0M683_RHOML|nr:hypothetical protein RHMOL_Rhmol10G0227900 [Rhododendron molle]